MKYLFDSCPLYQHVCAGVVFAKTQINQIRIEAAKIIALSLIWTKSKYDKF